MTQKPNKPIKARAMGVGVNDALWQRLEAAGLVIVDRAKLDKLQALVQEKPIEKAPPPEPEGMGMQEAAEYLGIKVHALKHYAAAGKVGFRANRGKQMVYRFHKDDLQRFWRELQ